MKLQWQVNIIYLPALIANLAGELVVGSTTKPDERKIVRLDIGFTMLALSMAGPALAADGAMPPTITIDPSIVACKTVTADEMGAFVGAPARITETTNDGLCAWEGSTPDAYAKVMYFTGETNGLPAGMERTYFDGIIEYTKREKKPGEVVEVPGVGDVAWGVKIADNTTDYYTVLFFKGKDNVTITTNGIGFEKTVEIARIAASRM
ncbi:hypothetical protein ADU59_21890 [Pararhizobium polonicum]|uniref:Uncharacterized protein n=1 Tax=Pararhizobium polonicum TaxID=1612624 RepID=A0A1C7NWX5_9HYPH|nr:hypothetical protein [Pararhizobium polonicum]OBZ93499.1 hypothetical protein ADU59_21890 [Pararhizobium polonicum]